MITGQLVDGKMLMQMCKELAEVQKIVNQSKPDFTLTSLADTNFSPQGACPLAEWKGSSLHLQMLLCDIQRINVDLAKPKNKTLDSSELTIKLKKGLVFLGSSESQK